jgi:hypothetical protein
LFGFGFGFGDRPISDRPIKTRFLIFTHIADEMTSIQYDRMMGEDFDSVQEVDYFYFLIHIVLFSFILALSLYFLDKRMGVVQSTKFTVSPIDLFDL